MSSLARILGAVVIVACLAVLAAKHPPGWLRSHVDTARAAHDQWAGYLASESDCPGRDRTDLSVVAQDRVMVCLLAYARGAAGLPVLPVVYRLNRSSLFKATDIVSCADFSHTACGKPFTAVFGAVGYDVGSASTLEGENIAWGAGDAAAPAVVVSGWLNSTEHRKNLLSADWREQGIAMVTADRFLGSRQVQIWVNEFGSRG